MENPDLVLQETGSSPTHSRLNYVPSGDTQRRDAISSLNRNKRSHDRENHCGYMIILDLAKSLFVNTVLRENLAERKVLNFKTGFKPKTLCECQPWRPKKNKTKK